MKKAKYLSLLLIATLALGGCNKGNTDDTTETTVETETTVVETTVEQTEATTEATPEATPTPTPVPGYTQVTEFEDLKINDYISVSRKGYIVIPQFDLEGADFERANSEINDLANGEYVVRMGYSLIKADSRRYSLVVYSNYDCEWIDILCYTFDVETNEILDNGDILAIAGEPESEFYDDASASLEALLEERCPGHGTFEEDDYEYTLSNENINKNMNMFLGKKDDLFLVSDVCSGGGASFYTEIWDLDGKSWSRGCEVDAINMADDLVVGLEVKGGDDEYALFFAHRDDSKKVVELYDYVDGELVLIDTLPLDGSVYRSYGLTTHIIESEEKWYDIFIDQDGKVSNNK